jgi:L-lactate dehydrogenase
MDMNHGLPFVPPVHIHAGEYSDCRGADVIVITAGARQKPGETRLDLVDRNAQICKSIMDSITTHTREALLLVVTNPVDIMTYAVVKYSGLPSHQVIGSGTVLDTARFRYLLGRHCSIDTHNVHAYVIGEHGDSEVLLWSQVGMAGTSLDLFCAHCACGCAPLDKTKITEAVKNSAYHIIEAKGSTNYGVALAVTKIVETVIRDENSVFTVSIMLNGEYDISECCLSAPCIVNKKGVIRIVEAELDHTEKNDLTQSAQILQDVCRKLL